jgi:hypothetical protein
MEILGCRPDHHHDVLRAPERVPTMSLNQRDTCAR